MQNVCPRRARSQVANAARAANFGCLPVSTQTLPSRYLNARFIILETAFFYAYLCRNKHTTCTLLGRKHFVVLKNYQSRDVPGSFSLNLPELKINHLLLHKQKFLILSPSLSLPPHVLFGGLFFSSTMFVFTGCKT